MTKQKDTIINIPEFFQILDFNFQALGKVKLSPIFIWGSPGIGKTEVCREYCLQNNMRFVSLLLNQAEPTDLKGLPMLDQQSNTVKYFKDGNLPHDPNSVGILLLDELNTASPDTQNAALSLILDRELGAYKLPEKWLIVAAGNLQTDRTFVDILSSATSNRFIHYEMEADLESWLAYAESKEMAPALIEFIKQHPEHLHNMDLDAELQRGWPSPRSWTHLNNLISANGGFSAFSPKLLKLTVHGAVGELVGDLFIDFLDTYSMWTTPEEFFTSTNLLDLPDSRPELKLRFLENMCSALIQKLNESNDPNENQIWLDGLFHRLKSLSDTEVTLFVNRLPKKLNKSNRKLLKAHSGFSDLFQRQGFRGLSNFKLGGFLLGDLLSADDIEPEAKTLLHSLVKQDSKHVHQA